MPAPKPEAAALHKQLHNTAAATTRRPWSTAADGAGVRRKGGAGRTAPRSGLGEFVLLACSGRPRPRVSGRPSGSAVWWPRSAEPDCVPFPSARRVFRALWWRRALTEISFFSSGAGGRLSRSVLKPEFSNGGKCWKYSRCSSSLLAAVGPEADTRGRSCFLLFCLVNSCAYTLVFLSSVHFEKTNAGFFTVIFS